MKKVVVLQHNGGRLANQLWLHVSVYAYALERGYEFENPSFFEYGRLFLNPPVTSWWSRIFFYRPYGWFMQTLPGLEKFLRKMWRWWYSMWVWVLPFCVPGIVIASQDNSEPPTVTYVPPSVPATGLFQEFEQGANRAIVYTKGWLFRNPIGIIKHREQIIASLKPVRIWQESANAILIRLQQQYKKVVGVHIRQGDFATTYLGGALYVSPEAAAGYLHEFLSATNWSVQETCFVVCSDGFVDKRAFAGLEVFISENDYMTDLLLLSSTDVILGTNSSFGCFAAYYGNKVFIPFSQAPIDWLWYMEHSEFFVDSKVTSMRP